MYKEQSDSIAYGCLHHSSFQTGQCFLNVQCMCLSWISFALLGPWRPQMSLSCYTKPTYSSHGSLQRHIVREMGANLQAWNTFKVLLWPGSAKTLA